MRIRASLLVGLVALGVMLVPSSPALAKPADGPLTRVITVPMKRGGVNHEVAAAHGYEVRVDSAGLEYPVKIGAVSPMNEVEGECGSSFVAFTAVNTTTHYTTIYTGFSLTPGWSGAIWVNWNVSVVDNYGASTKSTNKPLASEHWWSTGYPFTSGGPGTAYTSVLWSSTATLWDGTICFSYGPTDSAYL